MNNKVETLNVGTIRGRHEMPVTDYIVNEEIDPLDFSGIERLVINWFNENVPDKYTYGMGLNQIGYEDVQVRCSDTKLNLYVTGLTSVTSEIIKQCAIRGVALNLYHFNRDNKQYEKQSIF